MRWLERLAGSAVAFWSLRWGFLGFAKVFLGLRVTGLEHVPRQGGVVVASNHMSSWDPPMVGVSVPREIHFMAKKELFEPAGSRLLMLALRAFPVDRERSDIAAVKSALRKLQAGLAVGIFAQGTRNAGAKEALDGAAFLSQRAGVPLVPTAIWREGRRFRVRFGEALEPPAAGREAASATTGMLMDRIAELLPNPATERTEDPGSRPRGA